ncbi:TRAFAC clade GTPase domain-containing protein [Dactylosporangium salmoneum]|uniref:Double-GTPase 2 domain-containing protein n=1 Tax=Dactylosporangium salmoneum TaxID=53361 RepID=A0ABN3FKH5_9ACTN
MMLFRRLTCPYCYGRFLQRNIEFRCTGRPGPDGHTCAPVVDRLLQRHAGNATELPPTFRRSLWHQVRDRHRATCPGCRRESPNRICPRCHSRLPVRFGKIANRMIAMVGARESGKSVYLTVLLHEMRNQVGQAFNASMSEADDHTRSRFKADFERAVYENGELPRATSSAGQNYDRVTPLVFEFTTRRRTRFRGTRPVLNLLSFFDTAGEDLTTGDSVEYHTRYLTSADGIIVLLDPLQMPQARRLAHADVRPPTMSDQEAVLHRVTELLQGAGDVVEPIRAPLAVAFTKIDTLEHQLGETSPLRKEPEYAPSADVAFDLDDADEVHVEVRRLLNTWESGSIDRYVQPRYRSFRYFGVSALGAEPQDNRVRDGRVRPRRVSDPLLWLLSEFGAVPARRRPVEAEE